MCPSYLRIRLPKDEAMRRMSRWLGLPELESPGEMPPGEAVVAAVHHGEWRGVAFYVGERGDWTVFEDLTGYLSAVPASEWLRLAGNDHLVFAGYNDAIWWAELVVVAAGQLVREFREAAEAPEDNVNKGRLESEAACPIREWVDVSAWVDEDEFGYGLNRGCLWLLQHPANRARL